MDAPKWTDIAQTVIQAIALLTAILGAGFVVRQLRQVERTILGNTNERLAGQSFELLRYIAEHPETYGYLYERKSLAPGDPDRVRVLVAAEMMTNYLEHVALQRTNLPAAVWGAWRTFIADTCRQSLVVQGFLQERRNWYAPDLLAIADAVAREAPVAPGTAPAGPA